MSNHTRIAIDLAKDVFEVAVSPLPGKVSKRLRLRAEELTLFLAQHPPAVVVMEACGMAHFWGRYAQSCGHTVELLPPHYVRPYVVRNKTDRTDTRGILEAERNEDIKPVPVKTEAQQGIVALHRLRDAWMQARIARLNTIRGILREFGVTIGLGTKRVLPEVWALVGGADKGVPDMLRHCLQEAGREVQALETRIAEVDRQLRALTKQLPEVERLMTIPGIGIITATALYAFIGLFARFASGRHLASFLGLTPRERSSGNKRRLGAISKRGDVYLRMLLVHGARSVLASLSRVKQPDRLRAWAGTLQARVGHNKATVALANKIARIAWAVMTKDSEYAPRPIAA